MGIIWKFAMPLLSTLAALVIIVHSAEEDLEREYRYDLRPRVLNTETASNEQPWRVMKAEPSMKHTTENVWSQDSQEEPPKRRRKRKRRPIETSDEDLVTQERFTYPESSPKVTQDADYENVYQTTEIPRRRRKRINARNNRWADEAIEAERPIRRRGNRRKRPSLDTWPKLSEFPEIGRGEIDPKPRSEEITAHRGKTYISNEQEEPLEPVGYHGQMNMESPLDGVQHLEDQSVMVQEANDNDQYSKPLLQENKSLSEFSVEVKHPYENPREKIQVDKLPSDEKLVDIENRRNEGPLSLTLKEVLKQSNGSSLSEILQQHNLTLIDLLHNKENAIKVLKSGMFLRRKDINTEPVTAVTDKIITQEPIEIEAVESKNPLNNIKKDDAIENVTIADTHQEVSTVENKDEKPRKTEHRKEEIDSEKDVKNKSNDSRYNTNKRRFPMGMRRKLRMRPMVNNTYKSPLSRDMAALGLKRFPVRRNITKSHEWKSLIPLIVTTEPYNETKGENDTEIITTTTSAMSTTISTTSDDTTIVLDFDKPDLEVISVVEEKPSNDTDTYIEIPSTDITEAPITTSEYTTTTKMQSNITENLFVAPIVQQLNSSSIRRTAFNNRLKKKRLKQKSSTTEAPQNDVMKNLFGLGSLVSSSEFVAHTTVKNQPGITDGNDMDHLEDFMTTANAYRYTESSTRSTKPLVTSARPFTTTKVTASWRPTEETAEFEIEELLNDTRTSARLSRILMERNMTLNELVEHRERGSSHVHLADIFHNASREPNPPEPFLSKSSIEPISKETYPLRALLDAQHDTTAKATTIDPTLSQTNYIQNIPIVMDFGNNVNENAENMGIMSLFNNFTNSVPTSHTTLHDAENVPHVTNSIIVNTTSSQVVNRDSRKLNVNHDMVSWNDIFSMIRKGQTNGTDQVEPYRNDMTPSATFTHKNITLEEDVDGDGLIVLEDLQHLRDFDSNIASSSDEKLEVNSYQTEGHRKPSILNIPGNTKSVTVATASIVGLSMVLFLLTYAAFKWIQEKKKQKQRNFRSERIPSPVFENRKSLKHNSSTRSISPMLSSANIYTMTTLESHHGKDSPEYMWDTLRKPFQ